MSQKKARSSAGKMKAVVMAGTVLTAFFNTLALLLIAREMGADILGSLGLMLSFVGLFYVLGDMANGLAFSKVLDKGFDFRECYSAYLLAKLKFTVLFAVASSTMIIAYMYLLAPDFYTPLHPMSMFVIMGYFILANVAQIYVVSLAAKGKESASRSYEFLEAVGKVFVVLAILMVGLGQQGQNTVQALAAMYLVSAILGLMIVRNNARYFRRGPVSDEIVLEFSDAARQILPYFALGAIILNLDKVLLWYFSEPVSALQTVGVYFGAQRITIFIAASAIAIQGLIGGAIADHLKKGNKEAVAGILRMTERYITLVGLPIAAFYVYLSGDFLNAFLGEEFAGAGLVVSMLALAGLFTALASPHIAYLLKDDKYMPLNVSIGLGFMMFIIILGLFLPDNFMPFTLGLTKMEITAVAILVASIVGFIMLRMFTAMRLGCKPHPRILAHIMCTGVMIATINFVLWYFDIQAEIQKVLISAAIGFVIYFLCIYLAGEFYRKDYAEFKELTKD